MLRSALPLLESSTANVSRTILLKRNISNTVAQRGEYSALPRGSRHLERTNKHGDKKVERRPSNGSRGYGKILQSDREDFVQGRSHEILAGSSSSDANYLYNGQSSKRRVSGDGRVGRGRNVETGVALDESKFRRKIVLRDGKSIKLLTPAVLSARVTALCEKGQLNEAISLVKESPPDAQNSVVWTTLIKHVIMQEKYQEAYRLFTDMKRRGHRPTLRTYGTLLKGYTQIENWDGFSLQLNNVSNLYDQLMRHINNIKKMPDPANELSNIPFNLLIEIFGKAQDFQRMYDVFNAMESKGPLAPDLFTYTALISAIGARTVAASPKTTSDEIEGTNLSTTTHVPSHIEIAYKNAVDAKLLWKQLIRTCGTPDAHSIRAVFVPLSRGRPSDQNMILDIAHEYLGLSRPGERSIPSKIQLHPQTLNILLSTCNRASRYRHTIHYVENIIDTHRASMLAREHMDLAIEAHAALASSDSGESGQALDTLEWMLRMSALPVSHAPGSGLGPKIRPEKTTYDLVALACHHGGDWTNLCRTFELMTGYSPDDFRRGVPNQQLRGDFRMSPSGSFMACFIRTAFKRSDIPCRTMALNVLQYYKSDLMPLFEIQPRDESILSKQQIDKILDANRLAEGLVAVLPQVIESADFDEDIKTKSSTWLRRARAFKEFSKKDR